MHGGAGVAVLTLSEVAPGIRLHGCLEYLEMREGLTEGVPLFPLPGALGFSCGFVSLHHLLLDFRNAFPSFGPSLHNLPRVVTQNCLGLSQQHPCLALEKTPVQRSRGGRKV